MISSIDELETRIWRRGWAMRSTKRFSKTMRSIFVIKPALAKGFHIQIPFDIGSYQFQQPGIWIYALLAQSQEQRACYIGQSSFVMRRMIEHAKRSRRGRGSDAFFNWADQHQSTVHVVLLELSRRTTTKSDTAQRATILEGSWLAAAVSVGYQAPDCEKWGQLPISHDHPRSFCEKSIWQAAKPFNDVITHSPPLKQFWLNHTVQNS